MFVHRLLPRHELDSTTDPSGRRVYETPLGPYPSVTTILGAVDELEDDPEWRDKWVAAVGVDQAAKVTGVARTRGKALHGVVERYVMNDPGWAKGLMPTTLANFRALQPALDKLLGPVYGVEYPLWSRRLRTAGRTDLVACFDGADSVVDFKVVNKPKEEDFIMKYFVQAACYATMVRESMGLSIPRIVVAVVAEHHGLQLFCRETAEWAQAVESVFAGDLRPLHLG